MDCSSDNSIFESDEDWVTNPSDSETKQPMLTENGAVSLATTEDGRVDLFYKTVRGLSEDRLRNYLDNSWTTDPLDTLKMIFFIRDIRGKGKGEKKLFHQSVKWLMDQHPEAIRLNSKHIPFYGTYKDWLEIFLNTRYEKAMLKCFARQLQKDRNLVITVTEGDTTEITKKKRKGFFSYIWGSSSTKANKGKTEESDTPPTVTLAWKWAPSEGSHYDKGSYKGTVTKLCGLLGINKKEYRKTATLMRAHIGVVEGLMCGKQWDEIDFSKVPSRAMHIYKKAYAKHQPDRFTEFIEGVTKGTTKMNTGTLQPHEIVGQYLKGCGSQVSGEPQPAVEAQWVSYLTDLKKKGVSFDNCVSVVDTSGSMTSGYGDVSPMKVAYSFGLLVSQLCTGAFHNKWIEFSEQSKIHQFPEGSLYQKLKTIKSIIQNTNIQSVFETILATYSMFGVTADQQIKRIFIFTDGQFNQMTSNAHLTNFQAVDVKYQAAGFKRPEMIFWNVASRTTDFPVPGDTPDTALIGGYSRDMLQLFLDGEDLSPISLVLKAVRDERYDRITLPQ